MYFIATETITRECVSGMPNPLLFSGLFIQHKYLGALKSMQSSSDCTQQTQANVNVTWYCKLSIYSPCPAQICASATAAHIQTVPVCVPSLWKTWKHPFLYFCLWTNSTSTMSWIQVPLHKEIRAVRSGCTVAASLRGYKVLELTPFKNWAIFKV